MDTENTKMFGQTCLCFESVEIATLQQRVYSFSFTRTLTPTYAQCTSDCLFIGSGQRRSRPVTGIKRHVFVCLQNGQEISMNRREINGIIYRHRFITLKWDSKFTNVKPP